jgi:hypothetical protein
MKDWKIADLGWRIGVRLELVKIKRGRLEARRLGAGWGCR